MIGGSDRFYFFGCSSVCRRSHSKRFLGTLSNNDDDGSEYVTKKLNLRPFKLYRVYLKPHNSSNEGEFCWSRILNYFIHVQIEKGQFVIVGPHPPQNVALGGFTS